MNFAQWVSQRRFQLAMWIMPKTTDGKVTGSASEIAKDWPHISDAEIMREVSRIEYEENKFEPQVRCRMTLRNGFYVDGFSDGNNRAQSKMRAVKHAKAQVAQVLTFANMRDAARTYRMIEALAEDCGLFEETRYTHPSDFDGPIELPPQRTGAERDERRVHPAYRAGDV